MDGHANSRCVVAEAINERNSKDDTFAVPRDRAFFERKVDNRVYPRTP
ncbi:MAG: hypothetical protein SFZ23_04430 [Planctomycetota bacterium]|nr:hypothetical protein [Planctomycetota bacterium]